MPECKAHKPTPVKRKAVKLTWLHNLYQKQITFFLRYNMHDLIKHPHALSRGGTMVKSQQHADSFEIKSEVEVRRD